MLPPRSPRVLGVILIGITMTAVPDRVWSQSVERVVYVSVQSQSGRPVDNLAIGDIIVLENNIKRDVLRVSPAVGSFDIAVLVDTSQEAAPFVQDFRQALTEFFRAMGDRHQITLIGFGQRPTVLVDYTGDPGRLQNGLSRVFAQGGSGAYLMEGIIEAAQGLRRRESPRRVMIVIASESGELSNRYSRDVVSEVRDSELVLDAFVITGKPGVTRANEPGATRGDRTAFPELPDQNAGERSTALDEATRMTGGRHEHLATSTVLGARLRELAAEFNNQYRVIYDGRSALVPPSSIEVQTTRPDIRVRATWIPPK